jgi:hypothetical protein
MVTHAFFWLPWFLKKEEDGTVFDERAAISAAVAVVVV